MLSPLDKAFKDSVIIRKNIIDFIKEELDFINKEF